MQSSRLGRAGNRYRGRVPGTGWTEIAALAAAYLIAVLTTPAGISGAVLLLPFQVSVLGHRPSRDADEPALQRDRYPGRAYRYWRQKQTGGRLALILITGTLPGVIAGGRIRVELLPGARVFDLVIAAVLVPLGVWLALTRPTDPAGSAHPARVIPVPVLVGLAAVVGCVGGIYGIGGGLDPGAHTDRLRPTPRRRRTRRAGLHVRNLRSGRHHLYDLVDPPARPGGTRLADWHRAGHRRLAGAYTGARIQPGCLTSLIRRLVGVLVIAIGARYLWPGLR